MKCPKCGKDTQTIVRVKGYETINECKSCGCRMTDHWQSEIKYLRQALIDERNTVSALSRKCSQLECDREYNARLCEKKDAELSALKEENERLRSGLEKLERCYNGGFTFGPSGEIITNVGVCPVCRLARGHKPDCWLSALLKGDSNAN